MARRLWITADTHFGESGALKLFGRPFRDAAEMDEALVDALNRFVGKRDRLLHLGDFCGPHPEGRRAQIDHAKTVRQRLRCRRITLVRGNHDPDSSRFADLFESVHDLLTWRAGPDRLRVNACHWPMRLWRGQFKGAVLLHGHAHGGLPTLDRSVDVGVDTWLWKPVAFDALLQWIARMPVRVPDHWPRLQRDLDPERLPDLAMPG